jgi:hypothetical protein
MTAERQAGISGIAVAVLFGAGSAIWGLDMPEDGAAVLDVIDFYRDTADRIVAGATLSLLGIAAFLWFAAAVRRVLADAEGSDVLATSAFAGGLLSMTAGIGAETINMAAALRAQDDELSDELARSLFETSQVLGSVATGIGLGVFALATAAVALRSGLVLPRVVAMAFAVLGVVLLSPLSHVNWLPGAALVVITLVVGIVMLRDSAGGAAPPGA